MLPEPADHGRGSSLNVVDKYEAAFASLNSINEDTPNEKIEEIIDVATSRVLKAYLGRFPRGHKPFVSTNESGAISLESMKDNAKAYFKSLKVRKKTKFVPKPDARGEEIEQLKKEIRRLKAFIDTHQLGPVSGTGREWGDWIQAWSKREQRPYFYNRRTNKSRWIKPPGWPHGDDAQSDDAGGGSDKKNDQQHKLEVARRQTKRLSTGALRKCTCFNPDTRPNCPFHPPR